MRHVLCAHHHQLVLDDLLIARRTGLTRQLGSIEKHPHNPVIVATEPHEQVGILMFGTLIFDDGRYRCWYHTTGDGTHFCYAESQDGLTWSKPHLHRTAWHGSTKNNILLSAPDGMVIANVSVSKSLAEPDPARRYRAKLFMYRKGDHRGPARGHYLITSPDGIDWTPPASTPATACNECAACCGTRPARISSI